MKLEFAVFASLLFTAACSTVPSSSSSPAPRAVALHENEFRVMLGSRQLDEDDWAPVDEQGVLALEFAHQPSDWVVGLEGGFQLGGKTKEVGVGGGGHTDVTSAEFELYGGARLSFLRDHVVQPYLGAGVTLLSAAFEVEDGPEDDDGSFGFYAHGGIAVHPADAFQFGLDLRTVQGTDITLFGADGDGDYTQFALFVGWGF